MYNENDQKTGQSGLPSGAKDDAAQTASKALNVEAALNRIMNNAALYKKLLGCFERDYSDYDSKLSELIAGHDMEGATRMAHTMKGTAGNLGVEALQAASKDVEMACREGKSQEELNALMLTFSAKLQEALAAIAKYTAE